MAGVSGATFATLLVLAGVEPGRRAALLAGDEVALDALAAELNERRQLGR